MKWAIRLAAIAFGVMALSTIAPAVMFDPFSVVAAFLVGIFVGIIIGVTLRYEETC